MDRRGKKRITYRPSKTGSAFGGVVGVIFVLIGLFIAIPTFGAFGVLWTLIAVGITGMNFYQAFGKGYVGPEIHIEDEEADERSPSAGAGDAAARLKELQSLYDQRLITAEEYEEKRKEILKDL